MHALTVFKSHLLVFFVVLFIAAPAFGQQPKALIIGLDYTEQDDASLELTNSVGDARVVRNALDEVDIPALLYSENATPDELLEVVDDFVNSLEPTDSALVYFSGHALQIKGENYLLAGDGVTAFNLNDLLVKIRARSQAVILMLDACRNNPFSGATSDGSDESNKTKSFTYRGFEAVASTPAAVGQLSVADLANNPDGVARMDTLRGRNVLVFFATEPGNVAIDSGPRFGEHGPFAWELKRELENPIEIEEVMRRVSSSVNRRTNGAQTPWRQGSIDHRLYVAGQVPFPIP